MITKEGSDKRWWDYSDLIKTRAARWRMTMVVAMAFFGRELPRGPRPLPYSEVDGTPQNGLVTPPFRTSCPSCWSRPVSPTSTPSSC